MTDREKIANENLQKIAKYTEENLPEGMGFAILAFDFNEKGRMLYVSNANRDDIVKAMDEFKEKTKQDFGKHKDVGGKTWYSIKELMALNLEDSKTIWCLNTHNYSDFLTTMGDLKMALSSHECDAVDMFQFAIVEEGDKNAK